MSTDTMTKDDLIAALEVARSVAEWTIDDLAHPGVPATRQYLALTLQRARLILGPLDGALRAEEVA
jgi:hypothetical protein